ncbi:MAG: Crp/Fnr family transcriptional regulator [Clostridiales Family XIII bacterium]|jgi:CRP-like cAMP-binding protein|nr:Crp/Fnr family transcriptional regulator [Clostridiales Family XIII bacterium]
MNKDVLIESGLLDGISGKNITIVLTAANPTRRAYERGDVVREEGCVLDSFGVLEEGSLLFQRYHMDGHTQIAHVATAPAIVGTEVVASRTRITPTHIVAGDSGSILWFSRKHLLENRQIPAEVALRIQRNLLRILADDYIRFMNKADILSLRTVRERALYYFEILRDRHGDEINLGMTQAEFANYLCVDRTSLTHELSLLRQEGILDHYGKQYKLLTPKKPI